MGGKIVAVLVSVALVCASAGVIDAGPSGGALPPQLIQVLEVAGDHGVPDDAEMVAVNVAAVTPAAAGHLTVYPCDHDVPTTSNLNYLADDVVPNFALVRIADDGTICIATHAVADLVVDVVGYVPAGSSITALDAPVRVTDTRSGVPIQAGNLRVVDLGEVVEPDATMAMFNLTSVRAEARGHATVFPCTADVPNTSSLNYERRRTVANFVVARLSPDRSVCVYSHATSDFVIDVVASTADGIVTLDRPARVRDTRERNAPIGAGDTLELDLVELGGVPDDATAAVYNLTAASASARGHATSYPCDGDRPEASNLNYRPGRSSANSTITKLSASGRLCIDVHAATHLVVDLIGYTTDDTHYVPLTPTRALDTRNGWQAECPWIAAGAWESLETGHLLDIHPIDGSTPIRNTGFYDYSNNLRPGSSLDCEHVNVLRSRRRQLRTPSRCSEYQVRGAPRDARRQYPVAALPRRPATARPLIPRRGRRWEGDRRSDRRRSVGTPRGKRSRQPCRHLTQRVGRASNGQPLRDHEP